MLDYILLHADIRVHISVEVNCISLTWAQEAVFVVCLDDEDGKSSPVQNWSNAQNYEEELALRGKHILTGGGSRGHGLNRWYDATIQVCRTHCWGAFCFDTHLLAIGHHLSSW